MNFSGNMRRNNSKMPARGGGPLMTDHLHDLELELELLKRKRQLIQQQQSEMLYNHGPVVDNMRYNQPQPSQSYNNRFNEPQQLNFSHLYNEGPRDDRPFGLKRRAEPEWSNAAGDHFNNPMGANKRPRQSGPFNRFMDQNNTQPFLRPRPNQPQPLMGQPKSLLGHPKPLLGQPKPLLGHPKPLLALPKPLMNFQSQVLRRAPQPNMMAKQNQGPKPLAHNFKRNKQPGTNPRPGFTPNKVNMPFKKTSPVKTFNSTSPNAKREKKSTVLSANKEPSNKTNGRLELALGMLVKEIKVTYGTNPEYTDIFSTMQLARIMKQSIRERVHSVMNGKVVGLVPDIVAEYRQKYPTDTDKELLDLVTVESQKGDQRSEYAVKLLEEGDPKTFFIRNMGRAIENRFVDMMRKLEKLEQDSNNPPTEDILKKLPEVKNTIKGGLKWIEEDTNAEADAEKAADEIAILGASPKEKEYVKWILLYLNRKLPNVLAKNKSEILRLFELDEMFGKTKAAIIINTNKKAQAINNMSSGFNGSEQGNDPALPRNLPYFAKVYARPSIPKRKLMQEFLNQFNPKTIKRHKKNFNLLFIGFNDKDDYDRILAADQTVIGNATLSIAGNVVKTPTVEIDDQNDIDQVLTPQLDDQINDLLSSIRKADEESKANCDGDTSGEVDLTATGEKDDEDKVEEVTDSKDDEKLETNENDEGAVDAEKAEAVSGSEKAEAVSGTEKAEAVIETEKAEAVIETEKAEAVSEPEKPEATNESEKSASADNKNDDDCQVIETNVKEVVTIEDDEVAPLKSDGVKAAKPPGTPAKGRAPATPSSIRTRRSSRLVQN